MRVTALQRESGWSANVRRIALLYRQWTIRPHGSADPYNCREAVSTYFSLRPASRFIRKPPLITVPLAFRHDRRRCEMLRNRAHMILLLAAASVALTACDAGPSSRSAAKRPVRDSRVVRADPYEGMSQRDRRFLEQVERLQEMEEQRKERMWTDPRRFQR